MKFTATTRSVQGSSASRRLRRAGRVPAIVYGGQGEPTSIELDHNEIFHALRKEGFHSSVLDMELDGKIQNVLLRAVQWHAYRPLVLHVDFQRVRADEALITRIPVHFINGEESPAVKQEHAAIAHVLNEIEVSCLPKDLPQFIEIDLSNLHSGDVVTVADLPVPTGVTFLTAAEVALATASAVTAAAETDEAEVEAKPEEEGGNKAE